MPLNVDLAALRMKVEAPGLKELGPQLQSVDQQGQKTAKTMTSVEKTTKQTGETSRRTAAYERELAQAKQNLARSGLLATQSSVALDSAMVALNKDLRLATADFKAGIISTEDYAAAIDHVQREAQELRASGIAPVGKDLTAFNSIMGAKLPAATARAGAGLGTIRSSMASLTARMVSTNGTVGTLVGGLLQFGTGNVVAIGIIGGIAAIAASWRLLTKDQREAREELDKLVESYNDLAEQGRPQIERTEEAMASLRDRQRELMADLERAQSRRLLVGLTGSVSAVDEGQVARIRRNLAEVNRAIFAASQERSELREEEKKEEQDLVGAQIDLLTQLHATRSLRADDIRLAFELERQVSDELARGNLAMERRVELLGQSAQLRGLGLRTGPHVIRTRGSVVPPDRDLRGGAQLAEGDGIQQRLSVTMTTAQKALNNQLLSFTSGIEAGFGGSIEAAFSAPFKKKTLVKELKQQLDDGLITFEQWQRGMKQVAEQPGFIETLSKQILGAFGTMLVDFGKALIRFGAIMEGLRPLLSNPFTAGPAGIAAGVALIALGTAFASIAGGPGAGSAVRLGPAGGGSAEVSTSRPPPRPDDVGNVTLSNSGLVSSPMSAQQPLNITVIGENDGRAQRTISRLVANGKRRGLNY